jgi:hypothetical protein
MADQQQNSLSGTDVQVSVDSLTITVNYASYLKFEITVKDEQGVVVMTMMRCWDGQDWVAC